MKSIEKLIRFFFADSSPEANDANVFKIPNKPPPRTSKAKSVGTMTSPSTSGISSNANNGSTTSSARDTSTASSVLTRANDVSTTSDVSIAESLVTVQTEPMADDFNEHDADEYEEMEIEEFQRPKPSRFRGRITVDQSNIIEYDDESE